MAESVIWNLYICFAAGETNLAAVRRPRKFLNRESVAVGTQRNELAVVMKAKDLCTYIVTVTQKSPKQFRFTFVSRIQNLAMDVIENIYRANEVLIGTGKLN